MERCSQRAQGRPALGELRWGEEPSFVDFGLSKCEGADPARPRRCWDSLRLCPRGNLRTVVDTRNHRIRVRRVDQQQTILASYLRPGDRFVGRAPLGCKHVSRLHMSRVTWCRVILGISIKQP